MVKRGDVWLATLDPTIGSEIQKTRPVVVVSPDEMNDRLRTMTVVPMMTGSHAAPFRVAVTFNGKSGLLLPDQMRTFDRRRMIKRLGRVDEETLAATLKTLREMFTA